MAYVTDTEMILVVQQMRSIASLVLSIDSDLLVRARNEIALLWLCLMVTEANGNND